MSRSHSIQPEKLTEYLRSKGNDLVRLTFSQVEDILQEKLPSSARKYTAWWSNNPSNSVRTYGWLDAGFVSRDLDLASEIIVFEKVEGAK